MAESGYDGRVILEWPSPSGVAESEWSFPGSLWPSDFGRVTLAESAWPTENGPPKPPGPNELLVTLAE